MATTYTLISSASPTGVATITFSSIPSTYTDLLVCGSVRSTGGGGVFTGLNMYINGDTSALYSRTYLRNNSGTVSSARESSQGQIGGSADGSGATTNTFGSFEVYIPNYIVAQNRPMSGFYVAEDNSTTVEQLVNAALYRSTTTISSITLYMGTNFATNSNLYLYGIKNS